MQTVRFSTACAFLLTVSFLPFAALGYTTPGTGVVWTMEQMAEDAGAVIVWVEEAQHYLSTETITIAAGDSVTIFDNLHIDAVSPGQDISIFGALTVGDPEGAPEDSVRISGEDLVSGDGAGGFKVEEGGRLYLWRVVLEGHGADGIDDGVRVLNGSAVLDGCRLTGWPGYAARVSGGNLVIQNTLFHDNHEYTMTANLGSTLTLMNSSMIRNNLATPNSGKTAVTIGTQGENVAIIDGCYISGMPNNRSGGIAVWNLLGASQTATISNTTIEGCAFGINVQGGNAYAEITDCILRDNTAYSNPAVSGSGISIYAGGTVRASYNEITGNWWGITVPSGTAANPVDVIFGDVNATDYHSEGFNRIYDNGNSGSTWGLYNNSELAVLAQNNYWGSTDPADIADWIFDQTDDATKGLVTWEPFWDGEGENEPPIFISLSPDTDELTVIRFESYAFSVEASDPDGDDGLLTYAWHDVVAPENPIGTGSTIVTSFGHDNTTETTLRIVVTDVAGDSIEHSWAISVVSPPWPEILGYAPEVDTVFTMDGETVDFSITAGLNGEPAELLYYWRLDGVNIPDELSSSTSIHFATEGTFTVEGVAWYETPGETPWVGQEWTVVVQGSSAGEESLLPSDFAVAAYPNPFNAEMTVRYSLPQASVVNIAVFDLLGRQVAAYSPGLVQPGHHTYAFNAHNLASGLYFLQVEAGQWRTMRKVTLIR